jgi:flagellar hook protein FlgE
MYSGVSGLRSHQLKLDVIGNNISNVNTVAFKASTVSFKEMFNQTLQGAGAPDSETGRGGTNPMQIGLGTGVGSIDLQFTRGGVQRTDSPTDMSIDGDGMFIVRGGRNDSFKYTRAGNFTIDKMGNLVASNGMNVYGWQYHAPDPNNSGVEVFDVEKSIEPINLYQDSYNGNKRIIAPEATSLASLSGNLNLNDTTTSSPVIVPMTLYDAFGNSYKTQVEFQKTATAHVWGFTIMDVNTVPRFANVTGTVTFDNTAGNEGKAISATSSAPTNPGNGLVRDVTINLTDPNLSDIVMKVDLSKLTEYATDNSAKTLNVNGYNSGSLVTFNIGSDGVITGVYSNGQQQPLGQVALANFENPAGLQKVGDNMYVPTSNTGEQVRPNKPGSGGTGMISPGTLEMSNVDISKEFTEMITTQRGFQANSRVITTSDEILQELVNIKR